MSTLAQNNASVPRFLFFDTCMPPPPPRRMPNIFSPLPCRLFLKVETQNLASPVQLIAISTRYNTLTNKCLPPRETQTLASHKQQTHSSSAHHGVSSLRLPSRETQDFASLQGLRHHFSTRIYHMLNAIDNDAASLIHRNATFSIHDSSYSSPFIAHTVTFLSM